MSSSYFASRVGPSQFLILFLPEIAPNILSRLHKYINRNCWHPLSNSLYIIVQVPRREPSFWLILTRTELSIRTIRSHISLPIRYPQPTPLVPTRPSVRVTLYILLILSVRCDIFLIPLDVREREPACSLPARRGVVAARRGVPARTPVVGLGLLVDPRFCVVVFSRVGVGREGRGKRAEGGVS